ncbi:MAG: TRAP transporter large permease, partial [Alcaligenaceae bacterium]|nr:TRAP transporter large permease [Alcaligenaceae bacterium]
MSSIVITTLVTLFVLFALGSHVAVALGLTALVVGLVHIGSIWEFFGHIPWNVTSGSTLIIVPLFVLMGEILLRSGVTEELYSVLAKFMGKIPGGLLHTNIVASGLFSSISGSSVATASTIGAAAMPSMRRYDYDERMAVGTLAAGGTLGILIPPSVIMIVYGLLAEVSIGQLYIAGVVPGLLMMLMFMALILVMALISPSKAPRLNTAAMAAVSALRGVFAIMPILILLALVMGTIYMGIATATEAAAFGTVGAFLVALMKGRLNKAMLREAFSNTAGTTGMIMLILIGAFLLQFVLSMSGVPGALSRWTISLGLSQIELILLLCGIYLILGMFMESLAMVVMTVPIVVPVLQAMGVDLVWFGIIVTIMVEVSLITPPVGMNLFVIQGMRGRLDGPGAARPIT